MFTRGFASPWLKDGRCISTGSGRIKGQVAHATVDAVGGNSRCTWGRVKMQRVGPRILDLADWAWEDFECGDTATRDMNWALFLTKWLLSLLPLV
jgi:hypothetical protein